MRHKEIRNEIAKTRLLIIKDLREMNAVDIKNWMKRLEGLDHGLSDE